MVYVAQHKRTLRTSSYSEAAREFLDIENFLFEKFPDHRTHIKYRIVASQIAGLDIARLPDLPNAAQTEGWRQITDAGLMPFS